MTGDPICPGWFVLSSRPMGAWSGCPPRWCCCWVSALRPWRTRPWPGSRSSAWFQILLIFVAVGLTVPAYLLARRGSGPTGSATGCRPSPAGTGGVRTDPVLRPPNASVFGVFPPVPAGHGPGFAAAALAAGGEPGQPRRVASAAEASAPSSPGFLIGRPHTAYTFVAVPAALVRRGSADRLLRDPPLGSSPTRSSSSSRPGSGRCRTGTAT